MNLKLHPSTKEAFVDIISTVDIDKVEAVFQYLLKHPSTLSIHNLANIMQVSESEALEIANNKGELNNNGDVIGLLGLSISKTNHSLLINGHTFYTWCAADTLIFPSILNVNAKISSYDPDSKELIKISIENGCLVDIQPSDTMISWVDEVDDCQIRGSMCNRVHFFSSEASAKKWHMNNGDARIFPVTEFYTTDINLTTT